MRPEKISSQLVTGRWKASAPPCDARSAHATRIIELAHTLASAETAVLIGDDAQAVSALKRLQSGTLEMLAQLERPRARPPADHSRLADA